MMLYSSATRTNLHYKHYLNINPAPFLVCKNHKDRKTDKNRERGMGIRECIANAASGWDVFFLDKPLWMYLLCCRLVFCPPSNSAGRNHIRQSAFASLLAPSFRSHYCLCRRIRTVDIKIRVLNATKTDGQPEDGWINLVFIGFSV